MTIRIEYGTAKRDAGSSKTAENQRFLSRIYLRHDFTEKAIAEKVRTTVISRNSRITEFPKCMVLAKKIIAQHDNGYIDKIIRDKNSR
mgnify:CR=1 FL=1